MRNKLVYFIWVWVFIMLIQSSLMIYKVSTIEQTAVSAKVTNSGTVGLCINSAPVFNNSCNSTIIEHTIYNCEVNATDKNNNPITFTSVFTTEPEQFNISSDGTIYFAAEDEGNHSVIITIDDNTGCSNSQNALTFDFEIININDPPELLANIPGQSIPDGVQVSVFYLDSYFRDPDGEDLTYTVSGNSNIDIQIFESTSEVLMYSTVCDAQENVIFTAKDPINQTADSNSVRLNVSCATEATSSNPTGTSSHTGSIAGSYTPCDPDWQCADWTRCTAEGIQTKTCEDLNHCDLNHYIHVLERDCIYVAPPLCDENWECTIWSPCPYTGIQTRTCTDLNECGTIHYQPEEEQDCEYTPTCSDGLQNQGETGTDCGGPCPACTIIEIPGIIKERSNILTNILFLIIIIILSLLIIYKYFHKQINSGIVKMVWMITGKKIKRFLLSEPEKKNVLAELLKVEQGLTNNNIIKNREAVAHVARVYFAYAVDLKPEFVKEELAKGIKQKRIDELYEKVFVSFFNKVEKFEFEKTNIYKTDLEMMIEELRELVHETSKFKKEDVGKEIIEKQIPTSASSVIKIKSIMRNIYITMLFEETETAKNKYSEILKIYETLSEKKKQEIYEDITRLFNEITYFLSLKK